MYYKLEEATIVSKIPPNCPTQLSHSFASALVSLSRMTKAQHVKQCMNVASWFGLSKAQTNPPPVVFCSSKMDLWQSFHPRWNSLQNLAVFNLPALAELNLPPQNCSIHLKARGGNLNSCGKALTKPFLVFLARFVAAWFSDNLISTAIHFSTTETHTDPRWCKVSWVKSILTTTAASTWGKSEKLRKIVGQVLLNINNFRELKEVATEDLLRVK